MDRLERAARALLEQRDARLAALKGTEDEDRPDARGFAWGALTSAESREEAAAVALRAALDAAPEPAQAGEAVACGDINARLRQHVEGIKDQGCAHYGDPFSCDRQPNGTRSLRPCEPCLMQRLLDRAAYDAIFAYRAAQEPPRASSPSSGYCASDVCPTCGERSCPTGMHLPRAKPAEGGEGGA